MNNPISLHGSTFLEGIPGTGKTSEAAQYVGQLISSGVAPERLLVLVPQPTQSTVFREAAFKVEAVGGTVEAYTFIGFASQMVRTFWPLLAERAGFADPTSEPTFLNIETTQYYLARLANPIMATGVFTGTVSLPPQRILSQTLDNMTRSAMIDITLDEAFQRLSAGESAFGRKTALQASRQLADEFRKYCLANNLIDYSLVVELFSRDLMNDGGFRDWLFERYSYLIADNIEEMNAAAHDFIRSVLPKMEGALLIYDTDGGYRLFLGAEPDGAYDLKKLCAFQETRRYSHVASQPLLELVTALQNTLMPDYSQETPTIGETALQSFKYGLSTYYPQMIEWTAQQIIDLVRTGTPPREIAVVAPYLNDSLRFTLRYRLEQENIPVVSYRPSRALREEIAARAMLTLAQLAYPMPAHLPQDEDVADALHTVIDGLDPLRARLLVEVSYSPTQKLLPFDFLTPEARERITYRLGEEYEQLRKWLESNADPSLPLDHFWQQLFGDLLSYPGYRFFGDVESGRVIGQLIRSARVFRETLYPARPDDAPINWEAFRQEYFDLVAQGLLAGFYAPDTIRDADAVYISPAYSFLMQNRIVDYQFWLDIGTASWSERIDQPLTHPYLLRREFEGIVWNDDLELEETHKRLYMLAAGLARRCRRGIYLGISDLSEEGFEQGGLLQSTFNQIIRRSGANNETEQV